MTWTSLPVASLLIGIHVSVAANQEQAGHGSLSLAPRWTADQYLSALAPLELSLDRPLQPGESLGIVVGTTDVSALVELRGSSVTYRPRAMRLPAGQSEVAAYVVNMEGDWTEIGRFPLRVRNRFGLDQGKVVRTADMSSTGQLDQYLPEGTVAEGRRTFQDVTLRLGVDGNFTRGGWSVSAQGNALGVTQKTQRLRWSERAADAPALDLSDYRLQVTRGGTHIAIGNLSVGRDRHLINSFASRGLSSGIRLGRLASLEASLVNGSNVVGWDNPLGIHRPSHRIALVTLGLDLLPSRPGGVHVDLTGLDGSVLPIASFNQGAANDAEESRGFGVHLSMSDASQRVRLLAGLSRSRFVNPLDPLLSGDTTIVVVQPETRTARYGEVSLELLRGVTLIPHVPTSLSAILRHERIDPMYRSLAASVQADGERNELAVEGTLGSMIVRGSMAGSRDNLARVASVLTTRTRSESVDGTLPTSTLFRAPDFWFLPLISVTWQQVRQYGEGIPIAGGFSASHVPDQWNTNRTTNLSWTVANWRLAYTWNQSHVDNRQVDRENADFRTDVHTVSLGGALGARLTVGIDLGADWQRQIENATTQRLHRIGGSAQLQVTRLASASGAFTRSWGVEPAAARRTRNTEFNIEAAHGFSLYGRHDTGTQGRLFLRYTSTRVAFSPFVSADLIDPNIMWTLNAGASLRLY